MYCPHCGYMNPANTQVCQDCGKSLVSTRRGPSLPTAGKGGAEGGYGRSRSGAPPRPKSFRSGLSRKGSSGGGQKRSISRSERTSKRSGTQPRVSPTDHTGARTGTPARFKRISKPRSRPTPPPPRQRGFDEGEHATPTRRFGFSQDKQAPETSKFPYSSTTQAAPTSKFKFPPEVSQGRQDTHQPASGGKGFQPLNVKSAHSFRTPGQHPPQESPPPDQDGQGPAMFRPASTPIIKPASTTPSPGAPPPGGRDVNPAEDSILRTVQTSRPSGFQGEPEGDEPPPQQGRGIQFGAAQQSQGAHGFQPSQPPPPKKESKAQKFEIKGPLTIKKPWETEEGAGEASVGTSPEPSTPGFTVQPQGGRRSQPSQPSQGSQWQGQSTQTPIHKPWDIPDREDEYEEEEEEKESEFDKNFVINMDEKETARGKKAQVTSKALVRQIVIVLIVIGVLIGGTLPFLSQITKTRDQLFLDRKIPYSSDPDLWVQRAKITMKKKQPQNWKELAQKDLEQALKMRKKFPEAHHQMGRLYIAKGELKKAFHHLDLGIQQGRKPAILMTRGLLHRDRDKFEEAIFDFNSYIELKPNSPEGYIERGTTFRLKKQWDKGVKDYQKAEQLTSKPDQKTKIKSRLAQLYYERAYWSYKDRRKADMVKYVKKALKEYPKHRHSQKMLAGYYYRKARRLIEDRKYKQAMNWLNKAVDIQPDLEKAYFARGGLHLRKDQRVKALKDFRRAYELYPTNSKYFRILINTAMSLANLSAREGNSEKAADFYTIIIEVDPRNAEALLRRGGIYLKTGKYEKAVEDLKKSIEEKKANRRYLRLLEVAYVGLAERQFDEGKFRDALDTYSKALKINSKNIRALGGRAVVYYKLDQVKKGDRDLSRGLKYKPKHPFLIVSKARTEMELKNYSDAIKLLSKVIASKPTYWRAYIYRGDAYLKKDQRAKAKADYKKVATNAPDGHSLEKTAKDRLRDLARE